MARPRKEVAVPIHEQLEQAPEVEAAVVKPEVIKPDSEMATPFDFDKYYMTVEEEVNVSDDKQNPVFEIVEKDKMRREFVNNPHRIKCRIRAAKHYGVEIKHLQYAYDMLSGKKIDGIIINDLIDRHGFSDGIQANRKDVGQKNNINYHAVDVADRKLQNMIIFKNVLGKYKEYLETFTAEEKHAVKRDSFNV